MIRSRAKIFLATMLLGLVIANFASAALVNCGRNDKLPPNPTADQIKANECTIPKLITTIEGIINFLLSWAYLVAILFIVWSGWGMLGTGGNEESIAAAKTSFRNAIIGFFMIMTSFILLNFVVSILSGSGMPRPGALFDALKLLP